MPLPPPRAVGPQPRWQETLVATQEALVALVAPLAERGRLDAGTVAHWLATESALCRINALTLDAAGSWFDAQAGTLAILQAWAAQFRLDAQAAAADVRALGGIAGQVPTQLRAWEGFARVACGSLRVGEALGGVLLHGRAMRGPAREAVARVIATPGIAPGSTYLRRRLMPDSLATHDARAGVLDQYAASALGAGARRAADWYLDALRSVFDAA